MASRKSKWHHRVFGTVEQRRLWRDVALRRVGLARSHTPMQLVRQQQLAIPNLVRSLAADLLLQQGQLSFVQVGAFDGASDDDLTQLLPLGKVQGVLVEPQPEPFAALAERYAGHENLHLVNAAIAPERGQRNFYRPRLGASRLASFDPQNLLRHGVSAADIATESVQCCPLDAVLADVGFSRLDVLQIDAEGYDLQVLATLDFNRWRPSIVRFEYLHLAPRLLDACIADLASQGYQFLLQQRDLVACLSAGQMVGAA